MALCCSIKSNCIVKRNTIKVVVIVWIAFIFSQQKKSGSYKKVCEPKDFCNNVMPSEVTKVLEFNQ